MMQLLEAGGIEAFANRDREERMSRAYPDSNPTWLELDVSQMQNVKFLLEEVPEGCAVKIPTALLLNIPPRPSRIIWMHRDAAAVRASALRMKMDGFEKRYPEASWESTYHETTRIHRLVVEDRKSVVEILDVEHADLMSTPEAVCHRIGISTAAARVIRRAA